MSIQAGAYFLEKTHGGLGVLLGGVPGVDPAKVVVLGGGVVGIARVHIALGMGAEVWVLDRNSMCCAALLAQFGRPLNTVFSTQRRARAPRRRRRSGDRRGAHPGSVRAEARFGRARQPMRKGAVLVDVAIDQGGCFETSRPTTHADPVYVVGRRDSLLRRQHAGRRSAHLDVRANNATLPFVLALADKGPIEALRADPHLRAGLNVHSGQVTHPAVAEALGYPFVDPLAALERAASKPMPQ